MRTRQDRCAGACSGPLHCSKLSVRFFSVWGVSVPLFPPPPSAPQLPCCMLATVLLGVHLAKKQQPGVPPP